MNKNEYVIISRVKLLQRIEELRRLIQELQLINRKYRDKSWDESLQSYYDEITNLNFVLSNSIELIPEIEKAFDEGKEAYLESTFSNSGSFYKEIKQNYINQLKLDI